MERRILMIGGLAASLLAASNAAGEVEILSHTRRISVDTYISHYSGAFFHEDSDSDAAQTTDVGAWSDEVQAHAVIDWLYADASAAQDSLVSTGVLSGSGAGEYDLNANCSLTDADGIAESLYEVVFRVTDSQAYDLTVTMATWDAGWGLTYGEGYLWDLDTSETYFDCWHESAETTWTSSGTLPPGDYGLMMYACALSEVNVAMDTGWAWFDFTLDVPAPGSAVSVLVGGFVFARRRSLV
jgi:hypothetical protein